jgi:hypothetical protein
VLVAGWYGQEEHLERDVMTENKQKCKVIVRLECESCDGASLLLLGSMAAWSFLFVEALLSEFKVNDVFFPPSVLFNDIVPTVQVSRTRIRNVKVAINGSKGCVRKRS